MIIASFTFPLSETLELLPAGLWMAETPSGPATKPRARSWGRWLVILACLGVVGLGTFLGWRRAQDQADKREALRIAEKGDFSRSEPLLLRIAQRYPNDATVAKELAL